MKYMYLLSLDVSCLCLKKTGDQAVLEGVGLSSHVTGISATGMGQEQTVLTISLGEEGRV